MPNNFITKQKISAFTTCLSHHFCWQRLWAIIIKEFIQIRRDHTTFAMIIGVPLMQLILFGYAINANPKNLPTVVLDPDQSILTRAFITGLENTSYFHITRTAKSEKEATQMLQTGKTQFVVTFPINFTHDLLSGKKPQLLIEADATDPVATGSALAAAQTLAKTVFDPYLPTNLKTPTTNTAVVNVITHGNYNPESITSYNIVPGLLGVVLTMTMVIIASHCITREYEKGTIEHLLSTPVKPLEVLLGKLFPYILFGYMQVFLILTIARLLFNIPIYGSVTLLALTALPFIAANLAVGLTFSSMAKTQLQAGQMATFFFLPSMLLSGFMFPFRGMPEWAQYVGDILPLTYFLRIARGILLKGNTFTQIWPHLWPIMVFTIVAVGISLKQLRRTLD